MAMNREDHYINTNYQINYESILNHKYSSKLRKEYLEIRNKIK